MKITIQVDTENGPIHLQIPIPAPEPGEITKVILTHVGPTKINVIKEVRAFTGLGLKEAKELVDAAQNGDLVDFTQQNLRLGKELAKFAEALQYLGATFKLEHLRGKDRTKEAVQLACKVLLSLVADPEDYSTAE